MPSTKILFTVPQDHHRLGEILCDEGGTVEFEDMFETYDEANAFLADCVGQVITAEFEDVDDTLDPLNAFTKELDKHRSPYLGAADAFEERSRGVRMDGLVVYHLFGEQQTRADIIYPWSNGDPATNDGTLKTAGIPEHVIAQIAEKLMPSTNSSVSAAPTPR